MHESELRAFALLADTGRVDAAARSLGCSPPALTAQLRSLEESLGVRLFTHGSAGARLTRDGHMILPSVRALLILMDGIRAVGDRSQPNAG